MEQDRGEAVRLIQQVERARRMVAYSSAGDPSRRGEMLCAATDAGSLQRALMLLGAPHD